MPPVADPAAVVTPAQVADPDPAKKPPTQEEFNSAWARMKRAEEALVAAQAKISEHEAKGLSDVERLTREVAELKASADRAKGMAEQFDQLLAAEIQAVPEKYRGLVPGGTSADKVLWIRNARASGVFGDAAVQAAPATEAGKPTVTPKQKFTNSQIAAMSPKEFRENEAAINAAIQAGEISPD